MSDERPTRIWVHPQMVEELNKRKELLEENTGYCIKGGMPIVSKLAAEELKRLRERDKNNINVEVLKIKGIKKNEIVKIW